MNKYEKVTFCVNAKPPNYGKMKIHTKKTTRIENDTIKTTRIENDTIKTTRIENDTIKIIMSQTCSTLEVAVEVYNKFDGDLVDSIMYIEEMYINTQKTGV